MPYLADTNILMRWIEPGTVMCEKARTAVRELRSQDEIVVITPQNLVEFWNGATRPVQANGLGLSTIQADVEARQLEGLFPLIPDVILRIDGQTGGPAIGCWYGDFTPGMTGGIGGVEGGESVR